MLIITPQGSVISHAADQPYKELCPTKLAEAWKSKDSQDFLCIFIHERKRPSTYFFRKLNKNEGPTEARTRIPSFKD